MTLLEQYIAALNSGDENEVANLFADEASFDDGGARTFGFDDLKANGKENIRSAFAEVFKANTVQATLIKLNPASMEYDVQLGDFFIPCIGTATISNNLILEYIVRPR